MKANPVLTHGGLPEKAWVKLPAWLAGHGQVIHTRAANLVTRSLKKNRFSFRQLRCPVWISRSFCPETSVPMATEALDGSPGFFGSLAISGKLQTEVHCAAGPVAARTQRALRSPGSWFFFAVSQPRTPCLPYLVSRYYGVHVPGCFSLIAGRQPLSSMCSTA